MIGPCPLSTPLQIWYSSFTELQELKKKSSPFPDKKNHARKICSVIHNTARDGRILHRKYTKGWGLGRA